MPHHEHPLPVTPVTSGPLHHWFGYYDKFPWDSTGRYLLCLEVDFLDRPPTAEDSVTIHRIDLQEDGRLIPLATTTAWNWQMGTILQWLNSNAQGSPAADRLIIYNSRERDHYVSVLQDVFTGEKRVLPRPVYAVSRDAQFAMTLNFERVADTRPGYGYNGIPDPGKDHPHPADEGIFHLDLQTGDNELVISLDQIVKIEPEASFKEGKHWFNHLLVNQDNSRFIFLHRWTKPQGGWFTRLFTAKPDGSDIVLVNREEMTSHFDYRRPREILAWANQFDAGQHYYVFDDETGERQILGAEVFQTDGHCSYSPDGQWILTDTYPDREHCRTLILYNAARNERIDVGRFYSPPELTGEFRCDLHPRWSRDGRRVCFDSLHEGSRQMYVMDVSEIVSGPAAS
ncbi:MAG: hypothetical protein HY318_20910 [Armatimonadetes bacterium]|nr:hypothetical protein [Armatimonadota bacterium]